MEITMNISVSSAAGPSGDVEKIVKKRGRKPKQLKEDLNNTKIKTFHFNMLPETIEAIDYFATLHKHDERKTFKEEWEKWIQIPDIAALIEIEIARLKKEGYFGNVLEKLFHSARYYYRKKPQVDVADPPKKRKKYESIGTDILEKMDEHILKLVKENIVDVMRIEDKTLLYSNISPCNAFLLFLKTIEIEDEMIPKYKKTYKNRFFVIRTRTKNGGV